MFCHKECDLAIPDCLSELLLLFFRQVLFTNLTQEFVLQFLELPLLRVGEDQDGNGDIRCRGQGHYPKVLDVI